MINLEIMKKTDHSHKIICFYFDNIASKTSQ